MFVSYKQHQNDKDGFNSSVKYLHCHQRKNQCCSCISEALVLFQHKYERFSEHTKEQQQQHHPSPHQQWISVTWYLNHSSQTHNCTKKKKKSHSMYTKFSSYKQTLGTNLKHISTCPYKYWNSSVKAEHLTQHCVIKSNVSTKKDFKQDQCKSSIKSMRFGRKWTTVPVCGFRFVHIKTDTGLLQKLVMVHIHIWL